MIRPAYAALAAATFSLNDKVAALCKQPSTDALQAAKDAFAGAVDAWSNVEIFRFGPIAQDHSYERLFFWPDPKNLGLRQIEDALAKKDEGVTDPAKLAAKSVALQGLPALEYLLYGEGADGLATGGEAAAFRCSFASSIAANVDGIAKNVVEGWGDGSDYEKSFLGPAPDNAIYHTPKEVTLELFKAFASGIELVRDQKLGKPLGASADEAKPKLAAFWHSNLSFANVIGNLQGVSLLFSKGGFAQVVDADSPGVVGFDPVRSQSCHRGSGRHEQALRRSGERPRASRQARSVARRAQERGPDRRRHHRAERGPQLRLQRYGWRLGRWSLTAARF